MSRSNRKRRPHRIRHGKHHCEALRDDSLTISRNSDPQLMHVYTINDHIAIGVDHGHAPGGNNVLVRSRSQRE